MKKKTFEEEVITMAAAWDYFCQLLRVRKYNHPAFLHLNSPVSHHDPTSYTDSNVIEKDPNLI
jgi:hypothetical protein